MIGRRRALGVGVGSVLAAVGYTAGLDRYATAKRRMLDAPPDERHRAGSGRSAAGGQAVDLIILGDSRAAQWSPLPEGRAGLVLALGVGGETTAQTLPRLSSDALPLRPRRILAMTGVNDIVASSYMAEQERGVVIAAALRRVMEMQRLCAEAGVFFLAATVAAPGRPDLIRGLVWRETTVALAVELNNGLRGLPGVPILDAAAVLGTESDGYLPERWRADTLHLNRAAYERLNEELAANRFSKSGMRPLVIPRQRIT